MFMKAVLIEKPEKMRLVDLVIPEWGPREVLIKVAAAGICGSDIEAFYGIRPEPCIKYPVVLGHEFSGVVEKCGAEVTSIRPGERVAVRPFYNCNVCKYCRAGWTNYCIENRGQAWSEIGYTKNGGFAEYTVAPEHMVYKLPQTLSLEMGALAEPASCSWNGVSRSAPEPGMNIAVVGPGPIGLLAVNFYSIFTPGKLIIIGTRDERNTLGKKLGATHAINIKKEDPLKKIKSLTEGEGADIVFEASGKVEGVKLVLNAVRLGGEVALAGVAGTGKKLEIDSDYFVFKGVTVRGVFGYTAHTFTRAIELLNLNRHKIKDIITHEFSLNDYEEAFKTAMERKGGANKVLLKP